MRKLLVANRSEIAIRVFRAATVLGLGTVAVYTFEDRFGLHRFKADESYLIGPPEGGLPVKGYLDVDAIVAVAADHGVDAIHPGYGFLSENAAFARACAAKGITFVGPTAEQLETFGDKTAAKKLARETDVPTVPGTEGALTDPKEIRDAAKKIGYPLIIKASFGGGGRGMRVVRTADELMPRLEECQREAGAAFGRPEVFLERYIGRAKHIEVQLLGDGQGNLVHLWERDCSVQRRHQKVVEVAPSINLPLDLRQRICDAAVRLCGPVNYRAAGTVEFLLDLDKHEFFFIEVNPRIQVEHTVTEVVTGIDLVRAQLLVAQGVKLHEAPLSIPKQADITTRWVRHPVPDHDRGPGEPVHPRLRPADHLPVSPGGFSIRLDGGNGFGGSVITPYFDSLLVKLTTWGGTFDESHPPDGPGPAGVPHPRGEDEHPVPGEPDRPPRRSPPARRPRRSSTTRPTLFQFGLRRDRATKILSYLGDVIVNGRPDTKGKFDPKRELPTPVVPT